MHASTGNLHQSRYLHAQGYIPALKMSALFYQHPRYGNENGERGVRCGRLRTAHIGVGTAMPEAIR